MENELLNRLAERGCRISEALADTYMGVESLMVKIIRKVPSTTTLDRMSAAIDASDARGVFEAAHELKGLYATTALTPLYDKCVEIVEPARNGSLEGLADRLAELKALHAEFCALIGG